MSDAPLIVAEPAPGVRVLTLNRPGRLNALNAGLAGQLRGALHDADQDPACRVIVLSGAGRGFCAGFDLRSDAAGELATGTAAPVRGQYREHRWPSGGCLVKCRAQLLVMVALQVWGEGVRAFQGHGACRRQRAMHSQVKRITLTDRLHGPFGRRLSATARRGAASKSCSRSS